MLRTKYFRNLGRSSQKDFWKAVKLVRRRESSILALKNGPTLVTSNSDKALLLNEFFYSCFNDAFRPLTEPIHLDPIQCPPHLLCTEEEVMDLVKSRSCEIHRTRQDISHDAPVNRCVHRTESDETFQSVDRERAFSDGLEMRPDHTDL